jgi:tRNA pseudouridine38-40 synthase
MGMRTYLLTVEYDGTGFHGWQRQPGARTVQGEIVGALARVCGASAPVHGVSRTDAGVHAYGQRASFSGDFGIPPDRLTLAMNNVLCGGGARGGRAGDIRVASAELAPEGFHARFSAVGKKYIYRIMSAPAPDIFSRTAFWQVKEELDAGAMGAAASRLVGTRDFSAFRAAGGNARSGPVRTVLGVNVYSGKAGNGAGTVTSIEVTGDGFLYNMVRIIAGTLFWAGTGRMDPDGVAWAAASMDRKNAGPTAPPQGLYLAEVYYEEAVMRAAAARRFGRT